MLRFENEFVSQAEDCEKSQELVHSDSIMKTPDAKKGKEDKSFDDTKENHAKEKEKTEEKDLKIRELNSTKTKPPESFPEMAAQTPIHLNDIRLEKLENTQVLPNGDNMVTGDFVGDTLTNGEQIGYAPKVEERAVDMTKYSEQTDLARNGEHSVHTPEPKIPPMPEDKLENGATGEESERPDGEHIQVDRIDSTVAEFYPSVSSVVSTYSGSDYYY